MCFAQSPPPCISPTIASRGLAAGNIAGSLVQGILAIALALCASRIGGSFATFNELAWLVIVVVVAIQLCFGYLTETECWSGLNGCNGHHSSSKDQAPVSSDADAGLSANFKRGQLGQVAAAPLHITKEHLQWLVGEIARVYAVELSGPYEPPEDLRQKILNALLGIRINAAEISRSLEKPLLHEPLDDAMLGRLLIATDFDVPRSTGLVKEYIGFRRHVEGAISPCPKILGTGAFFLPFEDRRGRPILFIRARWLDPTVPITQIQQTFRAYMDAIILHLLRRRSSESRPTNVLEQYLCVIDTEGAGWNNVGLPLVKMLVRETNLYYPDRLQEILVLGVNSTVQTMWRMASPLVHPRTRKKVSLVAHKDIPATLLRHIEQQLLPTNWGGEGPRFPTPAEAGGLSDRVGAIAAAAFGEGQAAGVDDRVTVLRHKGGNERHCVYELRLQRGGFASRSAATQSPRSVLRTGAEYTQLLDRLKASLKQSPGASNSALLEDPSPADMERYLNGILTSGSPKARSFVLTFASSEPVAPGARPCSPGGRGGSAGLLACFGGALHGRICCEARPQAKRLRPAFHGYN
mmetsp:Transcript_121634/g.303501  ORF Transcript_121634/g.303501 Transcript_121634/m.303501 type:complete len:579 (+) Transcript_121634:36-1772(+)